MMLGRSGPLGKCEGIRQAWFEFWLWLKLRHVVGDLHPLNPTYSINLEDQESCQEPLLELRAKPLLHTIIPVVPHKAVAEVSRLANL